jgi:hypothetical protein
MISKIQNCAHGHLFHNFWISYKYFIDSQSEDYSSAHKVVIYIGPLNQGDSI